MSIKLFIVVVQSGLTLPPHRLQHSKLPCPSQQTQRKSAQICGCQVHRLEGQETGESSQKAQALVTSASDV